MRYLNSTLKTPRKIRFESQALNMCWEAGGSSAFDTARKYRCTVRAAKRLARISQQKTSKRTFNAELAQLAHSADLNVIFF